MKEEQIINSGQNFSEIRVESISVLYILVQMEILTKGIERLSYCHLTLV